MFKQSFQIIINFSLPILIICNFIPKNTFSKDFNKYSKVTFTIENTVSETIIGYYENYTTNPKRAYAKFNLNGELCEGNVTIKNVSIFKFKCNSGYSAEGSYFPSSKSINAMGQGRDSNGKEFLFRIHGNGTATKISFSKSLNSEVDVLSNKKINKISNKTKEAEDKCTEIGFKKGTEKYGDCVLKMLELKWVTAEWDLL